jgi:DNA-binding CsgD family transcriptional regulator
MVDVGGVQKLTERQREILQLLLNGHDAKSAARQIGISVHTVNEHLREARRSLGVSSSREAARFLCAAEGLTPNYVRPKSFGGVESNGRGSWLGVADGRLVFAGVALVLVLAAAVVAFTMGRGSAASASLDASPNVVATKPSAGATVAPGPFMLAVTFDQPMLDGNYSFVQVSDETYPNCETHPQLSADGRTFALRCTARAGQSYEVWFNRPPYMNFKSRGGISAQPYQLKFRARSR